MKKYRIYPLKLGSLTRGSERVGLFYNPGVPCTYPIIAWYLTDGQEKVLVDTGGPIPGESRKPYTKAKEEELDHVLARMNVQPEEITTIIFTHLHWDHSANNHLFPNARFFVQRKELQYAATPLPPHILTYDAERILETQYEVLDGDTEVLEGVCVMMTPGHTPGSQSVVVNTEDGVFVLIGDLTNLNEFWEAEPKVANGVYHSLPDTYESFNKVGKVADFVLTGHDPKVLDYKYFPNGIFPKRNQK